MSLSLGELKGLCPSDCDFSGHLVLSHLGLAFVLMLRPIFPGLVMSTDLLSFEHPSVLLFCFPFLSSNIPSSPAYGVFISQLIRYAMACSFYECFILRAAQLSSKLLRQGYVMERLKSSLRKFYVRYGDLIKHYDVSFSQTLHDILGHEHIQWHPQLINHYTNLRTYYRTGL